MVNPKALSLPLYIENRGLKALHQRLFHGSAPELQYCAGGCDHARLIW